MAQECEHLNTCGFFKKYQSTKDLACKGFIAGYCKGQKWTNAREKNTEPNMANRHQMT